MRDVLSYIIQNAGLPITDIFESASAGEALNILQNEKIDIIICDYLLEDMGGIEFYSKINLEYPEIVGILISGNVNYDELRAAYERGDIFRFIAKPFDEDEILSLLKDAIEQVRHLRSKLDIFNRLKDF